MTNISGASTSFMTGLKSHDQFFARIINMIPSELYRHSLSDDSEGALNTKYYKHRKMPLTADEKKTLSKQKIAEKYAPQKRSIDNGDYVSDVDEEDEEDEVDNDSNRESILEQIPVYTSESCNDINTLRKRLQERISGMKGDRTSAKEYKIKANEEAAARKAATVKAEKKKNTQKKRKHSGSDSKVDEVLTKIQKITDSANDPKVDKIGANVGTGLEFNNMLMIDEDNLPAGTDKNKGKPGSKVQRLKRLLEEAQHKREKLNNMSNSSNPDDQQALKAVKWSDAMKSATGDKSLLIAGSGSGIDAEAKIKKALKRKEKAKQKSAAEWKARLDAVEEAKSAKITKREENITERKNSKLGILSEADKEKLTKKNNNTKPTDKEGDMTSRVGFEGKKKTGEFLNKKNSSK